jgi:phosphatidylinositol alpha-mannosyltransferase
MMAMSAGLPVIASDLPQFREIIKNGENGLLFSEGDASSLAEKIRFFFSEKTDVKKMKEASIFTMMEKYGWENAAVKIAEKIR